MDTIQIVSNGLYTDHATQYTDMAEMALQNGPEERLCPASDRRQREAEGEELADTQRGSTASGGIHASSTPDAKRLTAGHQTNAQRSKQRCRTAARAAAAERRPPTPRPKDTNRPATDCDPKKDETRERQSRRAQASETAASQHCDDRTRTTPICAAVDARSARHAMHRHANVGRRRK